MDEEMQYDQLEPIYNSSVPIQDIALKTYRNRWTIEKGDGRGSGRSVLMVWHDDDDNKKDQNIWRENVFDVASEVAFSRI